MEECKTGFARQAQDAEAMMDVCLRRHDRMERRGEAAGAGRALGHYYAFADRRDYALAADV